MNRRVRAWCLVAVGLSGACGGRTDLGLEDGTGARNDDEGGSQAAARGGSGPGTGGTGAASGGVAGRTITPAGGRAAGSGGMPVANAGVAGVPNDAGRGAGGRAAGGRGAGRGNGGRAAGGRGNGGRAGGSGGVAGSNVAGSPDAGAGGSAGSDCIVRVATTGGDANDGSDWTLALATVQRGLDVARALLDRAACSSVDIWVAAGTYYPSVSTEAGDAKSATFELVPGVGLYGGFAGTEQERRERDIAANVSVLSGEIGDPSDPADNVYHVVTGKTDARLDGFTITAGTANGDAPRNAGGGMFNDVASPVIANCVFLNNSAGGGGAMYNRSASPVVTNCTFAGNSAPVGDGGAMYNDSSSPAVSDSTFTNNSARYSGGAMNNSDSWPSVTNCTFAHDVADGSGGAIANDGSSLTVTNSSFLLNTSYSGGALTLLNSSGTVLNGTFAQNSAYQGGALYALYSSLVVTNTVFWANSATGTAQFSNEALASGGALYDGGTTLEVSGSTFASNVASYAGGALYDVASSAAITNTILWGDTVGSSNSEIVDADAGSMATASYSIIQDGYPAGTGVGTADPSFVALASGDLRLGAASPAIDAGTGCGDHVSLTDRAGNGRWDMAGSADVVGGFDVGAFEYQGVPGIDTPISAVSCP